jgi:ethanolamine utilization protein EutQ
VSKVCQAQKNAPAAPAACPVSTAPGGIKLVKGSDVHLGVFPGAGADKQVGIADVITSADGAPIAAGFMAWSQCFFPWTLDYDEIDLVLEGELHIRCNGQTFVGKAGDVFYIPKGSAIEFGTTTAVRFFYVTYPANWQG